MIIAIPIFMYVTLLTKDLAVSMAQVLLEKKLIVCANWMHGEIENGI